MLPEPLRSRPINHTCISRYSFTVRTSIGMLTCLGRSSKFQRLGRLLYWLLAFFIYSSERNMTIRAELATGGAEKRRTWIRGQIHDFSTVGLGHG